MLRQRVDPDRLLVSAGAVPVGAQLVAIVAGPFESEPERTRRKPAVDQIERLDRDLRDMVRVARVEVPAGGRGSTP